MVIKSELLYPRQILNLRKYIAPGPFDSKFEYESAPNHTSVNVVDQKLQMKLQLFSHRFDNVIEAIRKEENIESFSGNSKDREMIGLLKNNLSPENAMQIRTVIYKIYSVKIFKPYRSLLILN